MHCRWCCIIGCANALLLQVVFTVDRVCQLLGVGLCGTEGSFTVELEVFEVRVQPLPSGARDTVV